MAKIALLGGSFDPPHMGHLMICMWALATRRADRVWLLPTYRHPLGKALTEFGHRAEMCRCAISNLPGLPIEVCEIESERDGASRTLETVHILQEKHPMTQFVLLIGADIMQQSHQWYRFDELQKTIEVVIVGRAGYASSGATLTLPDISSTEIRQRLATEQPVNHLVPAAVLDYITQHKLYRSPTKPH